MFFIHRFHEDNFSLHVFCDLFNLELPEVGGLDLDLTPGYCNDAVLGRLDALADFLAFAHIDLHSLYLLTIIELKDIMALIYQLVYVNL